MSNFTVAADQLRLFVERIERLEEEKIALGQDQREVYAEAKANGYDTKILRMVVRLRKMETHVRQEQDAVLDTYREALGIGNSEHYRRPRAKVETEPTALERAAAAFGEEAVGEKPIGAAVVKIGGVEPQDPAQAAQRLADRGVDVKLDTSTALNRAIADELEKAGYVRQGDSNVFKPPQPEPESVVEQVVDEVAEDINAGSLDSEGVTVTAMTERVPFPPAPSFDDPPADQPEADERPMYQRMREAMLQGKDPAHVE